MKILLEEKNSLVALLPGYYQLVPGDPFTPCALGLTDDALLIYDDYAPDEIHTDSYIYRVKKKIPLSDIQSVLNEKLNHNKNLDYFNRFNIIAKVVECSSYLYYRKSDYVLAKKILKKMKARGIRVKNVRVDVAPNS